MKRNLSFFIVAFCFLGNGYCQKIQYGRGSFKIDEPDAVQLVSGINGHHHLLSFLFNKKPAIHVFSPQLQLIAKKELDFKIRKNCDIKVLPFANHYLVYIHIVNARTHELWKVDSKGNTTYLSGELRQTVDTFFKENTSALQLVNLDGSFYLVAHTYYDTIRSIKSTIVQLDENANKVSAKKILFPFDGDKESLKQTTVANNFLFILKTAKDNQTGNTLELVKIDLQTNALTSYSFNSGFHFFSNPGFSLNNKDSSIRVYSSLTAFENNSRAQAAVFISRLNFDLQEQLPVVLLKSQFRQNASTNFIFCTGGQSLWFNTAGSRSVQRFVTKNNSFADTGVANLSRPSYGYFQTSHYNQSPGVRFTVLDDQFKIQKDSLVENNKKVIEIQPFPFARFRVNDKSYLVLIQNFTPKRRGLLMVSADSKDELSVTPLPVFDRYDYLLSQLQFAGENYFVVPFFTKNEVSIMKVTLTQAQ